MTSSQTTDALKKVWGEAKTFKVPSKIKLSELLSDNNDQVVFDRDAVVTVQPFSGNEPRRPLPISTISGSNARHSHIFPISGLALLYDIQEVSIEQTVELDDLVSVIESENRYLVKTDGQVIFGGHENSSAWQRLLCGTRRRFMMRLFDRSKQEALYMTRRLAFSFPLFGCYLQQMDVFEPPCLFLGRIQQKFSLSGSAFTIMDMNGYEVYTIEGPTVSLCACHYNDTIFNVLNLAKDTVTTIEHQWDPKIRNYKLSVIYPIGLGIKERALLLASGILLEYIFFQSGKTSATCCLNCHK